MRKLQYLVATSLDGYIAHEDESWGGFAMEGEHAAEFLQALGAFDTVLMGRRTYEVALRMGVTDPYPEMRSYVFSRTMRESPNPRVQVVAEDAAGLVRRLKREPGRDIWLCGGGDLAASLLAEGLIDEITLKVNPFVMGKGIPLFRGGAPQTALRLTSSKAYGNGVVLLRYAVA